MSMSDFTQWERRFREGKEGREKVEVGAVVVKYVKATSPPAHVLEALNRLLELSGFELARLIRLELESEV